MDANWWIIALIVVGYLAIGAFISGVSGMNDLNGCPDLIIMFIWPITCVVAALLWLFSLPSKLGEWIHDWRFYR